MKTSRAARFEGVVLTVILLVVGVAAGAASFTHVKEWTMANSPAGTGEWFGWANACISELVPIASLLTMRQRKRAKAPIGYPIFLLICAAGLSLAAQLAVAKPSMTGWLLSAVPALAFMALAKLVLAPVKTETPDRPATAAPMRPTFEPPAHSVSPPAATVRHTPMREPVFAEASASATKSAVPPHVVNTARYAMEDHAHTMGGQIRADELASRINIDVETAQQVLNQISAEHNRLPVLNGTVMSGDRR